MDRADGLLPFKYRELRNVLARAAILARGKVIRASDFPSTDAPVSSLVAGTADLNLHSAIAETERRVIQQALTQTTWNRTQAARVLGISRRQLFDKIQHYGLHQ